MNSSDNSDNDRKSENNNNNSDELSEGNNQNNYSQEDNKESELNTKVKEDSISRISNNSINNNFENINEMNLIMSNQNIINNMIDNPMMGNNNPINQIMNNQNMNNSFENDNSNSMLENENPMNNQMMNNTMMENFFPMNNPMINNNIMLENENPMNNQMMNNTMIENNIMNNEISNSNNQMMNSTMMENNIMNNEISSNNNQMNNFNQRSMNYNNHMNNMEMSNFMMDENELIIKELIKPYEDKIKELEETIRKNNFDLAVLKDKLYRIKRNNINVDNDIIEIKFQYQIMFNQKVKCLKDELIESVINRFCKKYNFRRNNFNFYFLNQLIDTNLTVSEFGITNFSIINVINKQQSYNNFQMRNDLNQNPDEMVNLIFSYKGQKILVFLNKNSTVKEALIAFLNKVGISQENSSVLTFLYNGKKLLLSDNSTLKEVFPQIGNIIIL